jgi:hypothetical protein
MQDNSESKGGKSFYLLLAVTIVAALAFVAAAVLRFFPASEQTALAPAISPTSDTITWIGPNINSLGNSEADMQIKYGHELIVNTAIYLGPNGFPEAHQQWHELPELPPRCRH